MSRVVMWHEHVKLASQNQKERPESVTDIETTSLCYEP